MAVLAELFLSVRNTEVLGLPSLERQDMDTDGALDHVIVMSELTDIVAVWKMMLEI